MRVKTALIAVSATLLSTAVLAPSAQADAQDGRCEVGEFCLFFNSGQAGSMVDMTNGHKDYGTGANCIEFITAGAGRGRCVKNNAASAWNREQAAVTVFEFHDWSGAIDTFVEGERKNLVNTKNDNASHVVGDPNNDRLTRSLYQAGGGRITTYFDGYQSTSGAHEGIDIAKNIGAEVYALTSGTVTNIDEGRRGRGVPLSDYLSTLAIYNAELNKTVVYLHTDPRNPLNVGDHVDRGDFIAFEDWRGVSEGPDAHTHVEMRLGRQTGAAASVNDPPPLDNPIPTEFWMNRGYNICCA